MPSKLEMLLQLVKAKKGAYGAQRVERAADEIKNLDKLYSPEALKETFLARPDYESRTGLITLNPADFEKYAAQVNRPFSEWSREKIDAINKIKKGFRDVPFLGIEPVEPALSKKANAQVYEHEGRHREIVLDQKGQPTSLVRIFPHKTLVPMEKGMTDEELIDQMRRKIGEQRLILPQKDFTGQREAVEFPEIYKQGGKVSQDAMHMAVMNQKVQKKSAGGKLSKWALEKLYPNRTYNSLNAAEKSNVTRFTNALSNPAVRRRESFSGPTLREQTTNVETPRIITPVDMYGKPLMPLTGDVSDAGFNLTQIAGIPLSQKVPVQGGSKYTQIQHQRGNPLGWASMQTAAEKKQTQAQNIAEQTGVAPYSVFTAMMPESINFSTPVIEAMLGQLHATKPSKAAVAEFNKAMREKWGAYGANPEFIGIDSPDVINQFRGVEGFTKEGAGDLRKKAVELMSLAHFRNMGFSRYGDVAEAIINPRLANAERGESGLAIFRADPNAKLISDPNIIDHLSYNTGIPMDVSEGSMQLKHSIPASILYKDIFETGRKKGFPKSAAEIKKGNVQRPLDDTEILGALIMRNDLYQPTTQEWLDANMNYLRKMYPDEYKKGGAVHMEDGGLSEADKLNKKTFSPSEISNLFNLISQRKQQEFNEFTGKLPKSNNLVEDLIRESKQELPSDPFAPKPVLKAGQSTKAQKTIEQMRAEVEANRRAADILRQDIQGIAPREGSEKPYAGRSTLFPEGVMRDVAEAAYRDIGPSIVPAQRQWTPSVKIGRQPSYVSPVNVETVLGEAGSALDMPSQLVGEAAFRATGSPALATAAAYGPRMIGPEGYVKGSKALANEAAYRIHQAMTKGEGPLAGALAGIAPRPLITWHGSPHRFPPTEKNPLGEFDPTKIGTGEGAQAYGYGHYLAENPKVADSYRRTRTSNVQYKGEGIINWAGANRAEAKALPEVTRKALAYARDFPSVNAAYTQAIADGNSAIENEIARLAKAKLLHDAPPGNFYKIDLPDEAIAKMLDWDLPFSQQSDAVRQALQNAGIVGKDDWLISGMKGREIYNRSKFGAPVKLPLNQVDDQIYASQRLREAGIPGIQYLDAGSRRTGEGTRNFVVFPGGEDLMNIVGREKKGGVVHKSEGGITSDDLIVQETPL